MGSGSPVRPAGVVGQHPGLQGSHGLHQVPADEGAAEKQACNKHLVMRQCSDLVAGLHQVIRV